MKVTVIGTGCTWYTRNCTSFILDDDMLFDVPSGNHRYIIRHIDIFKIKSIFISHFHLDHVGDLHIITTRFIRSARKNGRFEKLKIYAKEGLAEYLIAFNKLTFAGEDEVSMDLLKEYVEFIDVSDGMEFEENGYKVKVFKMNHGKIESYGFSFTDSSGKIISFTGDTKYCESLEKMLEISDYAFVDAAATREFPSHLHIQKFIELSEKYKNCVMYPIHTTDDSQKMAVESGINNVLNDGDILNL